MRRPATMQPDDRNKTLQWLLLAVILAGSVALWWPLADLYVIGSDDAYLIGGSNRLAAGDWGWLLVPQAVHILPLYKLVRLGFDLDFPARYHWMHAVAMGAHLANVILLYVLSRRYLRTAVAPLIVAGLFAWHSWGWEAMVVRSQNTFVLSLPFLLGAVACLTRLASGPRWAVACLLCLTASVGLHSLAATAAIPGVLLAYYLLGRTKEQRGSDAVAWAVCAIPLALGCILWLLWCLPSLDFDHHFQGAPRTAYQLAQRVWGAVRATVFQFVFLALRPIPIPASVPPAALGLGLLLWLSRRRPAARYLLTALCLTAGSALFTFVLRTVAGYGVSRYAYQGFLAVAVTAGVAADLALEPLDRRPVLRAAVLLLLLSAAPFYWTPKEWFAHRATVLAPPATLRQEFWLGWKGFFRWAEADAARTATPLRLPLLQFSYGLHSHDFLQLCRPRSTGIMALSIGNTHDADCATFWQKLQQFKQTPEGLALAGALPASLTITSSHQPPPGAELVCFVSQPKP